MNLNYLKGTQHAKVCVYGVEHFCCLFTLFCMGYKSKAFFSEACRAAHEDLIRLVGPFSAGFPVWLMKFKTCRQRMKHLLAPLWVRAPLGASLMSYSCQVSVEGASLGSADR